MAGAKAEPARLSESVIVIINAQREYVAGGIPLADIDVSIREATAVLERARLAALADRFAAVIASVGQLRD